MSYEELKKICAESVPEIDDISEFDEEEQVRIVKDYIDRVPLDEKVSILEDARKNTLRRYGIEIKENNGEGSFLEKIGNFINDRPSKKEEVSNLLKEAFAYTYVLGKEKPLRSFYDKLKEGEPDWLDEVTKSLPYKTYVENLEEAEYSFYERLDQVLNGEGAKFFEEGDSIFEN